MKRRAGNNSRRSRIGSKRGGSGRWIELTKVRGRHSRFRTSASERPAWRSARALARRAGRRAARPRSGWHPRRFAPRRRLPSGSRSCAGPAPCSSADSTVRASTTPLAAATRRRASRCPLRGWPGCRLIPPWVAFYRVTSVLRPRGYKFVVPQAPLYRCTVCEADWAYEAVRHIACCRACGGSLVRRPDVAPASPPPGRRFIRRRARAAPPLPAR